MHFISLRRAENTTRTITSRSPRASSAKVKDPDNPPWSEGMLGPPILRGGRGPQKSPTKVLITIRLDADVLAFFRAQWARLSDPHQRNAAT
jgi:uncharacterized protein (DUF4415 family)